MKYRFLALPLAGLLMTSSAFAGDPEGPPEAPPRADTSWYGYQPLVADGVAVGVATAGAVQALTESYCFTSSCVDSPRREHTASEALLGMAAATFLFASPTIHATHGHWGKAAASLGLRALPIAIAVPLMSDPRPHDRTWGLGVAVLLSGGLAAMIVDDAVLAREPVTKPPSRILSLAPTFDTANKGGGVSAVGTF